MLYSEKLAIAAHLHVVLRRKIGRVTDIEWMLHSADYAREVIRVASAETEHPELLQWAARLQAALFPAPANDTAPAVAQAPRAARPPAPPRYVASLR